MVVQSNASQPNSNRLERKLRIEWLLRSSGSRYNKAVPITAQLRDCHMNYELSTHSNVSLLKLRLDHSKPDVLIRTGKINPKLTGIVYEENDFKILNDGVFLYWENLAGFLIRNGQEIIVDPVLGADEKILHLLLRGPVFAILLHQRGILALHAATVEIDGGAVVLMGPQGCGKSTLAATLYKRGHGILADDVTAIQFNGDKGPLVLPGFPQLKLWPEVVLSLGGDPEELPRLEPGFEKRAYAINHRFAKKPIPLKRIYVLSENDHEGIYPLNPQEAMLQLIGNTYRVSVVKWIRAERHFLECTSLINMVPIKRLNRYPTLSILQDVARMVEEDLAHA
jgi:hypothetical protein